MRPVVLGRTGKSYRVPDWFKNRGLFLLKHGRDDKIK